MWCKKDLPVESRVPLSFLLGLRWQLVQWGTFTKSHVRVKEENGEVTMTIGRVPVVSVTVLGKTIKINWLDPAWATWEDLHKSKEMSSLTSIANGKLDKSAEGLAKGKGKGGKPQ